jgi:hypothetical protein
VELGGWVEVGEEGGGEGVELILGFAEFGDDDGFRTEAVLEGVAGAFGFAGGGFGAGGFLGVTAVSLAFTVGYVDHAGVLLFGHDYRV